MLMPIFGVKFRELGQTSYYSGPPELKRGDHVLIEADQGLTLAEVVSGPLEGLPGMEEQDLPDILRQADSTDLETGGKTRRWPARPRPIAASASATAAWT